MTPLGLWLSRFVPPKLWIVLRTLKNFLNAGSEATGAYSRDQGPNLPQPFLGGLKGAIVKNEVLDIVEKASNPTVEKGMSNTQAAILSAVSAILVSAIQGVDFSLLFSNPRVFASTFFTALVVAWAAYLKEPNRAKVDIGSLKRAPTPDDPKQ